MLIYRIIMAIVLPFVLFGLWVRRSRHLQERLGFGPPPYAGQTLWLHGASNGELASARGVVQQLLNARPDLQILITCNTQTARAMVQAWHLPRVTVALAPVDTARAVGRILRRWQPKALVIVENELWPARIAVVHAQGVPVLVIGARISLRSARRWRWLGGIMAQTLRRIAWLAAQDDGSRDRFVALGLPRSATGPVVAMKSLGMAHARPAPFVAPALRSRTVLAASTHDGDDTLVIDAFIAARAAGRFDHLILAPRHPRRADQIASLLTRRGLRIAIRSKREVPDIDTAVHLADTMGEMDHWYAMAGVTIICGTFSDKGGHTPWEPASYGSAILHGPDVANFIAPFAALAAQSGAVAVGGGSELAGALIGMTADRQAILAAAARAALLPTDTAGVLVDRILGCFPPL